MDRITVTASGELVSIDKDDNIIQYINYSALISASFVENIGHKYTEKTVDIGITDYSNELFIQYYVPQQEWKELSGNFDELAISSGDSINQLLWNDLISNSADKLGVFRQFYFFFYFQLFLSIFAIWFISLFRRWVRGGLVLEPGCNFCIVRSKATEKKFNAIKDEFDLSLVYEDIVFKSDSMPSMLSCLSLFEIIKILPHLFRESIKDSRLISKELSSLFGDKAKFAIMSTYPSRIVLKVFYGFALKTIALKSEVAKIYTGNKEDRFAMVEKQVAQSLNLMLVCIPHGLEYAFKFLGGVAGDKFYCTSSYSAELFSKIYPKTNSIFSSELQTKLYSLSKSNDDKRNGKVVFFTESRGLEVNRKIISELYNSDISFSVRLHPKDLKSNYRDFRDLVFENDYIDSISNVICLARKSTVLIEALYNKSVAIAFIIDSKDAYYVSSVFPSLNDNTITKFSNIADLFQFIKKLKGYRNV